MIFGNRNDSKKCFVMGCRGIEESFSALAFLRDRTLVVKIVAPVNSESQKADQRVKSIMVLGARYRKLSDGYASETPASQLFTQATNNTGRSLHGLPDPSTGVPLLSVF
jgi:hypothetical protein